MASIDLASNSALLKVAEKLAEQNSLLSAVAVRGERSFVRYSAYADGSDFTETWSAGQNYIGHAVGHEAPTEKEGYEWSLFASNIRETLTVTLPVSGWSKNTQTFETSIIGDGSTVLPTPTPECMEAYVAAGVMLTAATETSLIFTCAEVPTVDLVVEVYVTAPMAIVDGGVSSWNDLSDKPFGEVEGISDTVTWDGVTNEDDVFDGLQWIHRVTESVPTIEQLNGSTLIVDIDGQEHVIEITDANIGDWEDGNTYDICDESFYYALFVLEDDKTEWYDEDGNVLLLKKGVYFEKEQERNMFPKSLLVPGFEFVTTITKKIDSKYLPEVGVSSWNDLTDKPFYDESVSLGETVTWDYVPNENTIVALEEISESGELQQFCLHKVSTSLPAPEEFVGGSVFVEFMGESKSEQISEEDVFFTNDKVLGVTSGIYVILDDNVEFSMPVLNGTTIPIVFPTKGIYLIGVLIDGVPMMGFSSLTIPGYNFEMGVLKKLDPKFVHTPNWEAKADEPGEILNKPFYDTRAEGVVTLEFDGNVDGKEIIEFGDGGLATESTGMTYVKMSEDTPEPEAFMDYNFTAVVEGEAGPEAFSFSEFISNGQLILTDARESDGTGNMPQVPAAMIMPSEGPMIGITIVYEDYTSNGTTLTKGIWILCAKNSYFSSFSYYGATGELKKLDPKFVHTPDWNAPAGAEGEILNRPFYDYVQELGDTVTYDGEEVGENDLAGGMIHCLSHSVPTIDELKTGTVVICDKYLGEESTIALAEYDITEASWGLSIDINEGNLYGAIYVTLTDNAMMMGMLLTPKAGVYTNGPQSSCFIKSLTIPGHNFKIDHFKKIDSKFIDTPNWDAVEGQPGYIENKPFGKFLGTGDTLSKDVGYDEAVQLEGMDILRRMSDIIPTVEDLQTGSLYVVANANMDGSPTGEIAISDLVLNTDTEGIVLVGTSKTAIPFVAIVQTAGVSASVMGQPCTFNKTGIYLLNLMEMVYVDWLRIPGYEFPTITTKKIDAELLPDGIGYDTRTYLGDTVTWNGTFDDNTIEAANITMQGMTVHIVLQHVSSDVPTIDELSTGLLKAVEAGENIEISLSDATFPEMSEGVIAINIDPRPSYVIVAMKDGVTLDMDGAQVTLEKKGVYFLYTHMVQGSQEQLMYATELTIPGYNFTFGELKKIDPKYLPDGIGYEKITSSHTVTWDGVPTDGYIAAGENNGLQCVSRNVPTKEQCVGATLVMYNGEDTTVTVDADKIHDFNDNAFVLYTEAVFIVTEDGVTLGDNVLTKGIYFLCANISSGTVYTKSLTIPGFEFTATEVHKIDPKYLPEHSWNNLEDKPFGEEISVTDTLTWDGTPTDTKITPSPMPSAEYYWVSESIPTIEQLNSATLVLFMDGADTQISMEGKITNMGGNAYGNGAGFIVATEDDYTLVDESSGASIYFPKKGIYTMSANSGTVFKSLTIPNYEFTTTVVKKIDEKFIPEDSSVLTVNFSITADTPAYPYRADKTYEEMVSAVKGGKTLVASFNISTNSITTIWRSTTYALNETIEDGGVKATSNIAFVIAGGNGQPNVIRFFPDNRGTDKVDES